MADQKISALSAGTTLAGTEEIPGVQSAATVKFTPAQIAAYVSGNLAPATITGGTVTSSTPVVNATQTWNSGGVTFTGIKLNVTDTASASASVFADFQVGGTSKLKIRKDGKLVLPGTVDFTIGYAPDWIDLGAGGTNYIGFTKFSYASMVSTYSFGWSSSAAGGGMDTYMSRIAAGVMGVRGNSTGAAVNLLEMTAPSAPSANQVSLYAEDNGSGKTRLMALFPTGAAQQVAIEP